jgi:hypothetical protein
VSARTRKSAAVLSTAAAATAAALIALPANAATKTAAASPAVKVCGQGAALERPTTIILTCADDGEVATNLTWTDWSATGATATGRVSWRSGTPAAHATTWKSTGAQIILADPISEPGQGRVFTELLLRVTGPTPRGFMRDLAFDETPAPVTTPPAKLRFPPQRARTPHAAAASGVLGYAQIEGYWIAAGGDSAVAQTAAAITGAESSFEPGIIQQGVAYCGSGADRAGWGLWQITCGNSVPAYGIDFQLLDPWNNAEAAVSKYNADVTAGYNGFDPWSTYTSGTYENFVQHNAPATGLTDPGEYTQDGDTPQGTPASPAAARRRGFRHGAAPELRSGTAPPPIRRYGRVHCWLDASLHDQICSCVPGVVEDEGSSRHLPDCALNISPFGSGCQFCPPVPLQV